MKKLREKYYKFIFYLFNRRIFWNYKYIMCIYPNHENDSHCFIYWGNFLLTKSQSWGFHKEDMTLEDSYKELQKIMDYKKVYWKHKFYL